ncbi:MAG: polyprenyl synthetase family protein [Chloroflexota bacterium]
MALWHLPHIDTELREVEQIIRQAAGSRQRILRDVGADLAAAGGKRLRPALVLLGSAFGAKKDPEVLKIAAAVELLHMATLVHDDIIDDSPTRRGLPTAQARFGKDVAVFAGDFLLSKALLLLAQARADNEMPELARAMVRICEGEVGQFAARFVFRSSLEYLRGVRGKTAALFAISAAAGAKQNEADDKTVRALARYGLYLGMAFQIYDDLLDYAADSELIGKPVGQDLLSGVYTLPLLLSLSKDEPALRELVAGQAQAAATKIIASVRERGGIERAQRVLNGYVAKARRALESLPPLPERTSLFELPDRLFQQLALAKSAN